MAMFAGGASGVLCLIGGVLLLKRRLFSPRVCACCPQLLTEPGPQSVTGGTLNVFTRCRFRLN